MEIFINKAILHILDNDGGESLLSQQELDIDSDTCYEFITKHVKKLMDNPGAKEACFNPESKVHKTIQSFISSEIYFKEASVEICQHLLDIMLQNVDIPSADVILVQFEMDGDSFLALLKLNYKECFTHQVGSNENGADNQIVKYRAVLPFDSGKVEEACLIPYHPMVIKLIEKPYSVDGETKNYFSELFLDCSTEFSKKEVVKKINEITEEITQKFFNEDIETEAKLKAAILTETIAEDGMISMTNVASSVFGDNEEVKNEYISLAKEAGILSDIYLGEKISKQQFSVQKFKASNGIELKFPVDLSDDPEIIEFINNDDGSVSIMLKNLRKSGK